MGGADVRRWRAAFPLAVALALSFSTLLCRKADAVGEFKTDAEAERLLVEYIRIDTSNPPGNETRAAEFFQRLFTREGIESRLIGIDPSRRSIYARLSSGSSEPALVLLHHLDVVPVNRGEWTVPPFSGEIAGGYIWGRGALDIKSLGIANFLAFVDLKRRKLPLGRDVIFLGVADEERGGLRGAKAILDAHPELFQNAGFVLNEGGGNETVVDRVAFWGIEFDQKVPLWIRVSTKGASGHGALPPDDGGAAAKLVSALERISRIDRPYRLTDSVKLYFSRLSASKAGEKAEVLAAPERHLTSPKLESALPASYRALLRDTIAITYLQAGHSVNSLPQTAVADLDVRLLPGSDPKPMIQRIRDAAGSDVEIEILLEGTAAPPSAVNTPLYSLLESQMRKKEPSSKVGPIVSAGTSDSRFFRQRGIVAYGISPFKVNYYDADSVHAADERIRVRFFSEGVGLMRQIVRDFCVRPGP